MDQGWHSEAANLFTQTADLDRGGEVVSSGDAITRLYSLRSRLQATRRVISLRIRRLSNGEALASSYIAMYRFEAGSGANAYPVHRLVPSALGDHVLPFDTAWMREGLTGIEHPTIWTAERNTELWTALRGT